MVKKFLAFAAVLFLGCASVFASSDVEIELLDEEMDYEEFYETFGSVDTASDYFAYDLEECVDISVIVEFIDVISENLSGLDDETVVLAYDDGILFVYHWGAQEGYAFFVE